MKRRNLVVCPAFCLAVALSLALAAAPHRAAAQDASKDAAKAAAQDAVQNAAQARERTRQALLYGIDSEVLDIVQRLKGTGESSFSEELAAILSENRGAEVRRTILELFADRKGTEGAGPASAILRAWQDEPTDVVVAAIAYLSAITADGRASLLLPLAESPVAAVAGASIRALGKAGDPSIVDPLLKMLARPDVGDTAKSDIVLALGDLGDRRAVPVLLAIVKNRDENKVRRMYAADSLGSLGDPVALPALREMFAEKDALLRAYAASALAHFDVEEAFPLLLAGLKDENWRVRAECAKALARPLSDARLAQALPILSYKAELDPTSQVKLEAIRALGAIGGGKATAVLVGLYRERKNTLAVREESLGILARTSLGASGVLSSCMEAVRAVVAEEWKAVDPRVLEMTARVISAATGPEVRETLLRFVESANPVVRIYGVRGIAGNRFADLRDKIRQISEKDPHPAVQREAAKALEKM
jgi:HEAT repeat protein